METEKWAYLLTGLMLPAELARPDTGPILAESTGEANLEKIGIRLKKVFLTEKDDIEEVRMENEHHGRFVFSIKDGIKDDNLAQSFADAVVSALTLIYDLTTMEAVPEAMPIPEDIIKKGTLIRITDIIDILGSELYFTVMQTTSVPGVVLDDVWRVVPAIVENKPLGEAARLYRESMARVWVTDNFIFELMQDTSDVPTSPTERENVETAYQTAFKAIEAILGEPPKDREKLRTKLLERGINPEQEIGFELPGMKPGKEKLLKKLVDIQQTSGKRTGPGKTGIPKTIGYCELKDKQALVRHILLSLIYNT